MKFLRDPPALQEYKGVYLLSWNPDSTLIFLVSCMPSGHEKHIPSSVNDEPDEWDLRIERGGCAQEHFKLQDCYMETKDLRKCKDQVDHQ